MVNHMRVKPFSLVALFAVILLSGCGTEKPGSLRIAFNAADGEQNAGLLTNPGTSKPC